MEAFEKVHTIFELLRKHNRTGMSNKQISVSTGYPPSTTYRILSYLKKYGYVYQRKEDTKFFLGFALMRLAEAIVEGTNVATVSLPFLEELHYKTDETTFFTSFNGNRCVVMEVFGHINTRVNVGRGEIMPFHCTASGKAILAFLSEKEQHQLLGDGPLQAFTSYTNTDLKALYEELKNVYSTGVSFNHQGLHEGYSAVATPIFGNKNMVVGSIAIVGFSSDLDQKQMEEYGGVLIETSDTISSKLGGGVAW